MFLANPVAEGIRASSPGPWPEAAEIAASTGARSNQRIASRASNSGLNRSWAGRVSHSASHLGVALAAAACQVQVHGPESIELFDHPGRIVGARLGRIRQAMAAVESQNIAAEFLGISV